jgi:hypothetical protein
MRRLHPILILIGLRLRASAPEGQKRFPASFLAMLALSAGLVLFPARADAAYVATELAVLAEATIRVVRAVNGSTEVVGGAPLGSLPWVQIPPFSSPPPTAHADRPLRLKQRRRPP